jgi:hypothetical protein
MFVPRKPSSFLLTVLTGEMLDEDKTFNLYLFVLFLSFAVLS